MPRLDLEMPVIRKLVFRFAWKRALLFCLELAWSYCKHRKEFKGLPLGQRWRVLLLTFKTHLGSQSGFWDPLYEHIAGRPSTEDNLIWDQIIPPGYAVLQKIERCVPSHAGEFKYPIPKL